MCGDGVGMGNNAAGTGRNGDSWEKNHAGTGGDGVSVDFAGRGWGQISVPMQLSSDDTRTYHVESMRWAGGLYFVNLILITTCVACHVWFNKRIYVLLCPVSGR